MKLVKALFINRAPFEKLALDFNENNIFLLIGVNGKGKTTFLSYVVDSFYELAKQSFYNEFEGKANKYYRLVSGIYAVDQNKPSIVYLRYTHNGKTYDYVDAMGEIDRSVYDSLILLDNKISFNKLESHLKERNAVKCWSLDNRKEIEDIFDNGIYTFFPSYRFEIPNYLNDPYKTDLHFKIGADFSGNLKNPIEVSSCLDKIANWIMDVVLDNYIYGDQKRTQIVRNQLNEVLTRILSNKVGRNVRFGIGPRQNSAQRIAVVDVQRKVQIYPTIFSMSSGEIALLCLFAELIKQADLLDHTCYEVEGIVLIDEIDKHLHITLQKDALPILINMFPNVEFIVTSHSPFFSMGLAEGVPHFKTFDFDNGGLECQPLNNQVFKDAYNLLITENNRFAEKYNTLIDTIKKNNKPLVITEGKTDWKHIKSSIEALGRNDLDVEFYEYESAMGDSELLKILKSFSRIAIGRVVIGVFDRDDSNIVGEISNGSEFVCLGNEIYAFCIPAVNEAEYGSNSSIEHYYKSADLLKKDVNGRRLFLGKEFYQTGNSINGKYYTKTSNIKTKVAINGIIDEKVFDRNDLEEKNSIALSKTDFANLIYNKDAFAESFDFSEFNKILDIIQKIANKNN